MNRIFRLIVLLLGVWLGFDLVAHLVADVFWFQEVGYLAAFLLRIKTQLLLGAIAFILTAGFLLGNLYLAHRLKYPNEIPPTLLKNGGFSPLFLRGARGDQILTEYKGESFFSPSPQSPIPSRQSPVPSRQSPILSTEIAIASSNHHRPQFADWVNVAALWSNSRKLLASKSQLA